VTDGGAELLIVDSLNGLSRSPAVVEAPARAMPAVDAAAVVARLQAWQTRFQRGNAPATVRAVRSDWLQYATWCDGEGYPLLPASADQLEMFLRAGILRGLKRATIDRYTYTVDLVHRAAELPSPTADPSWADIRKGLVRDLRLGGRNKPRQAVALRNADIDRILATLGDAPRDLRDAAMLSLASDTLLRESELAAVAVEDLGQDEATGEWSCTVPFSKTDQAGEREDHRFVSDQTAARLRAWLDTAGITSGPVFRPVGGRTKDDPDRDTAALRAREVARIFRRRALAAGIPDAPRISGHSTRVGSANDLMNDGATVGAIQHAGGWTTDRMVIRYTAKSGAGRGAMAQLRRKERVGDE
jgi:integrase